jgi:nucleoside-diphosphate-sugar epimerase
MSDSSIIRSSDLILITGSNGFIGSRVVEQLLAAGFTNLRCFVRPSSNLNRLNKTIEANPGARIEILSGNLLSRPDCELAARDVAVAFHLAAGIEKTFPGSFMNSVVTTRNLLDALVAQGHLKRFVNISSFAVYSNWDLGRGALLDETCPLESRAVARDEAYAFAKLKQDELVNEYAQRFQISTVTLRPGAVYGPGKPDITARVGIKPFGIFFHLGGGNQIPITYVDNCASAIVTAGLAPGVDGEVFNIVDDDLPSSRKLLKMYKQGRPFRSLYVPYWFFYGFSWFWESYSRRSKGQVPLAFNRLRCATYWKGNRYSNQKLKTKTGWRPQVSFSEASRRYFDSVRKAS